MDSAALDFGTDSGVRYRIGGLGGFFSVRKLSWPTSWSHCHLQIKTSGDRLNPRFFAEGTSSHFRPMQSFDFLVTQRHGIASDPVPMPGDRPLREQRLFLRRAMLPAMQATESPRIRCIASFSRVSIAFDVTTNRSEMFVIWNRERFAPGLVKRSRADCFVVSVVSLSVS